MPNHSTMEPPPLPDLYRLRWNLKIEKDFQTPNFLGSALRGLLGHGLKRVVCVTRRPTCKDCDLLESCPYPAFFEPASIMPSQARVPYVLSLPFTGRCHLAAGSTIPLEMTLFAPHQRQFPYLVHAFQRAGKIGLGSHRIPFSVPEISCLGKAGEDDWIDLYKNGQMRRSPVALKIEPPPIPERVNIEWLTPLRLKRNGHLVGADRFGGNLFMESLAFRCYDLSGTRPDHTLLKKIREKPISARTDMYWHELTRYSSRQRTRMQIGGLLGKLVLDMEGLETWWPCLWAAQWFHLGKFTSIGLGRYRLVVASLPNTRDL